MFNMIECQHSLFMQGTTVQSVCYHAALLLLTRDMGWYNAHCYTVNKSVNRIVVQIDLVNLKTIRSMFKTTNSLQISIEPTQQLPAASAQAAELVRIFTTDKRNLASPILRSIIHAQIDKPINPWQIEYDYDGLLNFIPNYS
jgi:hypothetical protein